MPDRRRTGGTSTVGRITRQRQKCMTVRHPGEMISVRCPGASFITLTYRDARGEAAEADELARATNTSVDALVRDGIFRAVAGLACRGRRR